MWVCNECDATFEKPYTYYEDHGPEIGKERWIACPYCNGADIEEISMDIPWHEGFLNKFLKGE